MKKVLSYLMIITPFILNAQDHSSLTYDQTQDVSYTQSIKNYTHFEYYESEKGNKISVGDTLIIGAVSSSNKQYNQYTGAQSVFSTIIIGKVGTAALLGMNYLGAGASTNKVIVEFVTVAHTKLKRKSPLSVAVFVRNPNIGKAMSGRTILDIEKALSFGEIIDPNAPLTRSQAIAKLKESKDLLDLGLLSEDAYKLIKSELTPIIMGG